MNFDSMPTCNVVKGILMQTNATWDQASLCLMQCCDIVLYRGMDYGALMSHVVMMDIDWNTHRLCECKDLNNVCQCLFTV